MKKTFMAKVEEADGEFFIPLPRDLLARVGWQEGDSVVAAVADDGTITIAIVRKETK
jgi:antitoxin component of MazEF toxin-antitoxin module